MEAHGSGGGFWRPQTLIRSAAATRLQAGRRGEPLVAVYCATKAAVISLTQSAALNLIRNYLNGEQLLGPLADLRHAVEPGAGLDADFSSFFGDEASDDNQSTEGEAA